MKNNWRKKVRQMQQIDIFDILDKQPEVERVPKNPVAELSKGDYVKVKTITVEEYPMPEDYYYLKQFESKKGHIVDIHIGKVVSYTVNFGAVTGMFHEGDLIYV